MSPTVRSRLLASGAAFVIGFILANYGILRVAGPDRWLWSAIAVVLMATGAVGVIISDSPRRVSVWAIVGFELMVAFTLVPLLWTFSVATAPDLATPTAVLPQQVDWSVFGDAWGDSTYWNALLASVLVGSVATVISLLVGLPAAHAFVQNRVPSGRHLYLLVISLLLAPVVVFQGAIADQLRSLGFISWRLSPVLPVLVLTIPLTIWLGVAALHNLPWTLRDAIRVEGGGWRDELRSFVLPIIGPNVLLVGLLVFIVAVNDVTAGAVMTSTESSRLLPATMLLVTGDLTYPSGRVAAMGLLLLVPALVVLFAAPRRILHLVGRTYR
jgi:ABC-type glycerol-3-phosphate transport system permease component